MPDDVDDIIKQVRDLGGTDQQLQVALRAGGFDPGEIDTRLAPKVSAGGEIGNKWDELLQGLQGIGQKLVQPAPQGSVESYIPGANAALNLGRVGSSMLQGLFREGDEQAAKIDLRHPAAREPVANALHHIINGVPLIGPASEQASRKFEEGNYGAGVVDSVAAALQGLSPEDVPGVGKLKDAVEKTSSGLFTKAMKYPERMSLDDMEATTKLAQQEGFRPKNRNMIDAVGNVDQPGTYLHSQEKLVENLLKPHAGEKISRAELASALQDKVKDLDPGEAATAKTKSIIQQYIDDLTTKEVPATPASSVLGPNGQPASGARPATRQPLPDLTVAEAQAMKRSINREIAGTAFADRPEAVDPAESQAKQLQLDGLRDALEKRVPGIKQANANIHNAIQLKQQLEKIDKQHPGMQFDQLPAYLAVGGLVAGQSGMGAAVHAPLVGASMASLLLARNILMNPKSGTAFAQALHNTANPLAGLMSESGRAAAASHAIRAQSNPQ